MLIRKILEKDKKKKKKRKIYKEEYIEEEIFMELPLEQNPHAQTVNNYFETLNVMVNSYYDKT